LASVSGALSRQWHGPEQVNEIAAALDVDIDGTKDTPRPDGEGQPGTGETSERPSRQPICPEPALFGDAAGDDHTIGHGQGTLEALPTSIANPLTVVGGFVAKHWTKTHLTHVCKVPMSG